MSIDWRKSVWPYRRPRSSTTIDRGSTPAARYSSARRQAVIEPPKPDPTIDDVDAFAAHGSDPVPVRSLLSCAAVGKVGVAVWRDARQPHHPVSGPGRCGRVTDERLGAECRERDGGRRLPHEPGRVVVVKPAEARRHAGVEAEAQEVAAVQQRPGLELPQERRCECVEADLRVVKQRERVRLNRAGRPVDAGDRERVDAVAEVGPRRLTPGEDRVGEGLQGRVGQRHIGRVGGRGMGRKRDRGCHERAETSRAGALQGLPAGERAHAGRLGLRTTRVLRIAGRPEGRRG